MLRGFKLERGRSVSFHAPCGGCLAVLFELGLVSSRLALSSILKAVPKPTVECEELEEISHLPSPCAAHLRILFSLFSTSGFFFFNLFYCSGL
jgi:hypothetical protein